MRPRTGVALNVRDEPEAYDRAVNDRRLSVYAPCPDDVLSSAPVGITPASKFRMLLHTNPTRERGECLGTRAGASEDM